MDEATKLKDMLGNSLNSLREAFKQQLGVVQGLTRVIAKYQEDFPKSMAKLYIFIDKVKVLEETCSDQKEEILKLQQQLIAEKEKSEMAASETRIVFEDQQRTIHELQERLAEWQIKNSK